MTRIRVDLALRQQFTDEEIQDIKEIADYLYHFYGIWNVCELREYSYDEIKQQAVDEFLRRRYAGATSRKRLK